MDRQLWLEEFGESHRPDQAVLDLLKIAGVQDCSWHNDVRAHFEFERIDGMRVELWFDAALPADREDIGDGVSAEDPRYYVYVCEDKCTDAASTDAYVNPIYMGEDGGEAANVFRYQASTDRVPCSRGGTSHNFPKDGCCTDCGLQKWEVKI